MLFYTLNCVGTLVYVWHLQLGGVQLERVQRGVVQRALQYWASADTLRAECLVGRGFGEPFPDS